MAKLPDASAFGQISAASNRGVATFDTTGYARGAAAIAGGVSDLGSGIKTAQQNIQAVYTEDQRKNDQLDEAKAESQYLIQRQKLRDDLSRETDPTKVEEKYTPQFQQARDQAATLIQNPQRRELWTVKNSPSVERDRISVTDHVYGLNKSNEIANATTDLEQLRDTGLKAQDPAAKDQVIQAGFKRIEALREKGYIDATKAQALRQGWVQDYSIADISSRPLDEQIKILTPVAAGRDQVVDRIMGVEWDGKGNPKNPMSSATGYGQFTDATWLSTIKAAKPELANGRSDADLLALRMDKNIGREMTAAYAGQNAAYLSSKGIEPTPGNVYLAHFLGPGGAEKVLKASPDTPVADLVDKKAIEANRSVLEGKTAGTVAEWATGKMGGGAVKTGTVIDFIPFDKRQKLLEIAKAKVSDEDRIAKLQETQTKQESDAEEQGIFARIHTDDPKLSLANDILQNGKLSKEAKVRMTAQFESRTKDRPEALYGKGFWDAYQRIHLPEGDPNRITDPSTLYPMAVKGGTLTPSGVDKLVSEIKGRNTPEGEAASKLELEFFKAARSQITGTNEGLHMRDPKGDQLFQQFQVQAMKSIADAKKSGKSVFSIFDEKSPEYPGKLITQYKRPMNQWFSDMVQDGVPGDAGAKASPAPFDPNTAKSVDDLVEAYRSGKIDRATAADIAVMKGWAKRKTMTETPTVPISR